MVKKKKEKKCLLVQGAQGGKVAWAPEKTTTLGSGGFTSQPSSAS